MPVDDEERAARRRESRKKYNTTHPDRVRETRRKNLARHRARLEAESERRTIDRERAREWAAAHPERARERSREWALQNPERRRELQRQYYQRNQEERRQATREQNARRRQDPAQREREWAYQAARREARNAQQNVRRSNPELREKSNQEQNERRRRERRRRQLGLPPRRAHRSTINEREANATAARSFFSRRRGAAQIRSLLDEQAEVRAEAALAPEASWGAELERRIRSDATRPARIAAAVTELLASQEGARLREEVRMDSIARKVRGVDRYPDAETEVRLRALNALAAGRVVGAPDGHTLRERTPRASTFPFEIQRTRAASTRKSHPSI